MIYALSLLAFIIFAPAILVAIGLPFRKELGLRHFEDGTTISHYDLPDWLYWLQNDYDGVTGDRRGWYWNVYMAGKPALFKMWWWSAFRNPWNNLKRKVIGINMKDHTVTKVCGVDYVRDDFRSEGFQILRAGRYPMLYWVRRWGQSDRAIVMQLGWKIKLSYNELTEDKWCGLTFEPNPCKDIS